MILLRSTFHMKKDSVLTKSSSQYVIMFQRYSDFCNMQMRFLMTSSTQNRPNKLSTNEEYIKQ